MMTTRSQARAWMLPLLVAVPALWLAVPLQASAQTVATSFEELRALVKPGDTVYVTEASGRRTKGRLGELSTSSLELLVRKTGSDGRESFMPQARLSEGDVRQILLERRDSLLNGTLIGLASGAGPWILAAAHPCFNTREYPHSQCPQGLLVTSIIGTAVGAAIDALIIKRTTVYYRAPGQRSSGVLISPLFSKSGAGIQMSLRF